MPAQPLPTGTLTFLFTDIVESTRLWEQAPDAMMRALTRHDEIIKSQVSASGGYLHRPRGEGDSQFIVFTRHADAVAAAVQMQRCFYSEPWQTPKPLKIRMGLHTGEADLRMGDYYGSAVNRCARIRSLAHGSQTLISRATAELTREHLPAGVKLRDMGRHRLRGLTRPERLFQLVVDGLPDTFPAIQTADHRLDNLPVQFTDFVGRRDEIALANRLLSAGRLVTIVGPGGTGKTRLAIQIAESSADAYRDGICFASLAAISNGDAVLQTIAEAFELPLSGEDDLLEQLRAYLRSRHLLLILDNFEHVVECASIVGRILSACPHVTALCTSRERLNLSGESVLALEGLAVAEVESVEEALKNSAVQLFVQSAVRARPRFALSPADLPPLRAILRAVEGVPLGIILAAAWVDLLSVAEIAEEVGQSLDLLESELVDSPERHRSLRAVFDYSWNLLSESERDLFHRLSIFRGGFTREAARRVVGASVRALAGLSHKSLLIWDAETGRFQVHELLRQFAAEKLAASPEVRAEAHAAHALYYTELVHIQLADLAQGRTRLTSPDALVEAGQELANVRAAWAWAVENRDLAALERSLAGLGQYYLLRGPIREGQMVFEDADRRLASDAASDPATISLRAHLLASLARFLNGRGLYAEAIVASREAIALSQEAHAPEAGALARLQWSRALWFQGHYQESYEQGEVALAGARSAHLPAIEAESLRHLGTIFWPRGEYEEAGNYFQQALTLYREIGNRTGEATALNNLGIMAAERGKVGLGRQFFTEAAAINREVGARRSNGRVLTNLGLIAWYQGDYLAATSHNREALAIHRELGSRRGEGHNHKTAGWILSDLGRYAEARTELEEGLRLLRDIGALLDQSMALLPMCLLLARLGDHEGALLHGLQALKLAQEVGARKNQADAFTCIGHAMAALDRPAEANEAYQKALVLRRELGQRKQAAEAQAGLARLAQAQGDLPGAMGHVETILDVLDTVGLEGAADPFRVYLAAYQVLQWAGDERAKALLRRAQESLQAWAARIDDPQLRRSFLEQVPVNAALLAAGILD